MPDELVVDTSVIAAMLLREPGWQAIATRLASLDAVRTAPFFRFECANVVWKQRADAAAIDLVGALPVDDRFDVADAKEALRIGLEHGLPFYDAAFLALATRASLPLWTLDRRQADVGRAIGVAIR